MLKVTPSEVVTDAAPIYPAVLHDLFPSAWHHIERYANNPIEADHSQLKHRLRPMRGLRTDPTAQVIIAGHAFMQTSAAATTNSLPTNLPRSASPRRSLNSRRQSDPRPAVGRTRSTIPQRNGAPRGPAAPERSDRTSSGRRCTVKRSFARRKAPMISRYRAEFGACTCENGVVDSSTGAMVADRRTSFDDRSPSRAGVLTERSPQPSSISSNPTKGHHFLAGPPNPRPSRLCHTL